MTESSTKLRVLVIDEYFPYPADSGKPIRTWNLLRRLSDRHDVTLLTYGDGVPLEAKSRIKTEFVAPFPAHSGPALYARLAANLFSPYPYSVSKHFTRRFLQRLRQLIRDNTYDLIQCEWTPYARYLNSIGKIPSVIATHNVESQIWFRRSENSHSVFSRLFFRLQAEKMERFERRVLRDASRVTAVSDEDAARIRQWGVKKLSVVDNGVDLVFYRPDPSHENEHEMLFLASLDWEPNLDGLNYFLSDILPHIVKKQPDAMLTIAGRKPSEELRRRLEGLANVTFMGEMADVRPALERAAVVVVPLRVGGGSRLKILEAMAMGKAIVSTAVGAEGLSVQDDRHLMIADTPEDFAIAVISLMASQEKRRALGRAGRDLVEAKYSWDECAGKLEAAWYQATYPEHPSPGRTSTTEGAVS